MERQELTCHTASYCSSSSITPDAQDPPSSLVEDDKEAGTWSIAKSCRHGSSPQRLDAACAVELAESGEGRWSGG